MRQSIVPRRELFVPARSGWEGRFAFKHWRYAKSLFQSAVGMSHVAIQKWTEVSNVQLCSFHGMYAFVTVFFISAKRSIEGFQVRMPAGVGTEGRIGQTFPRAWGPFRCARAVVCFTTIYCPAELANMFGHCQVSPVLFGLGSRHAIDHCQHD